MRKFIEQQQDGAGPDQAAYSLIDLGERVERESWRLPVWVRNDLAECGIRFPAFDVGFELYWAEAFPETPSPFLRHRWLKRLTDISAAGGGDLATVIAAESLQHLIASVPFVGLAIGRLGKIAIERGARSYLIATNDSLKELFRAGRLKPAAELEAHLPFLLAADLDAHRQHNPNARFVIIMDEYERCLEQGGGTDLQRYNRFESSIRDFVAELRATLFVVAGREPLRWEAIDDSWASYLAGQQYKLGGLPIADAERLLEEEGITEPAVRAAMLMNASAPEGPEDAEPVYPLLLDLQVQHWKNRRAGRNPADLSVPHLNARDFEGRRTELLQRLLRDYEPPLRATLMRLSVPRSFDRPLFEHMVRSFVTGIQLDAFEIIVGLSFLRKQADGPGWIIHQG
ncbi:MAG: hypothetical protein JOY71_13700, partial [Acetobacteraceae bacterium]|nr:hypothetical protein [Acetobacteraceae bacterium]